ncbi:endo alpha-1,4 polygalactosaminidase [Microbacterium aerolatum]|uniref:endo alpha-1,4 polygalactosaminidase n=1 Tax=Microbacterium aerolatum TaxID=153731 RepID=UPI0038516A0E
MTLVHVAACAAMLLVMSGCAAAADDTVGGSASLALPPAGAVPDYQLGGAYPPADGVGIVGRDRGAEPADGVYSICYVNAFQTQPGELDSWPKDLLLHTDGAPVFDPDWPDEALADTSTDDKRERIAEIVTPWITGCAADGFDAVEFDNLDSYTRSGGALDLDDNLALAAELVDAAHAAGLAAGQKNAAEDAAALREHAGFDFAVVEECAAYEECEAYTEVYGPQVIDIEYTDQLPRSFAEMCADADAPASMVLRDRDLLPAGAQGHTFETC